MSAPSPSLFPSGYSLRSAMKQDDEGGEKPASSAGSIKAVQIAEPEIEPDVIVNGDETQPKKQFSAGVGRRMSGRPAPPAAPSSRASLVSQNSFDAGSSFISESPALLAEDVDRSHHGRHSHGLDVLGERLIAQVAEWLEHEKTKIQQRKTSKRVYRRRSPPNEASTPPQERDIKLHRSDSIDSQSSEVSLDRLQRILDDSMGKMGLNSVPTFSPRLGRRSHRKRSASQLRRYASSDTEYHDGDVVVPGCDAFLDNSKTLSYSGGKAGDVDDNASISSKKSNKERRAWVRFKNEAIRIAHTLRLKGWRQVPLDAGDTVDVERLSGALTNAVYVVSAPESYAKATEVQVNGKTEQRKKPIPKLLLRVYGPRVEHIIDREKELSVLRRLARKKIGPRLLGTFENGRYEQFFNAITLRPADIREPDTSRQIAKRMRELHDGIELLEEEKDVGPTVWLNWDRWLDRVESVITYLDKKIIGGDLGAVKGPADAWKDRGFICGVEWHTFRKTVENYRQWLNERYGGQRAIRDRLVFAHNDTQYGNILRIKPDDEKSPLLQPANQHKRLVVIDFEYAGANVPGVEFANHFSEWTYNYHDAVKPYMCNHNMYPKPEEQRRFIKAYVDHRPGFPRPQLASPDLTPLASPAGTPGLTATTPGTSSIVDFMLDARAPHGGWNEEEKRRDDAIEQRVRELMEETRLWRVGLSAQWVAWGIVQAKVPGLDDVATAPKKDDGSDSATIALPEEEEEEADEFDYLGYAQERAMFFWGDCVLLGLVKKEELPKELQDKLKLVDY